MQNALIYSFIILSVLSLIVKMLLNFINRKYIRQHSNQVPSEFQDKIDLESHKKAALYSIDKLKFGMFQTVFNFIMTMIFVFWGYRQLDQFIQSNFNEGPIITGLIYIGLLSLITMIIGLPGSLYSTFVIEEKFGFNKTTPKLFVIDTIKSILMSIIIGAPLICGILYFMQYTENNWWLWAGLFFVSFQFVLIWAYPKFIAPLFNKFTPLEDKGLIENLNDLLKQIDLKFKDFYIMNASIRSSHGNAYFTGFGKNKRIVFFDTLLKSLSNNEVLAVLAHELGHLKHKHITKKLSVSIIFLFISFYLLGYFSHHDFFYKAFGANQKSDYMALVLFFSVIPAYTFLFTPISSWFSRKDEYEADDFACKYSNPSDLMNSLIKLSKDNSSTLTPHPLYSKFYYSHPPALERIENIKLRIN